MQDCKVEKILIHSYEKRGHAHNKQNLGSLGDHSDVSLCAPNFACNAMLLFPRYMRDSDFGWSMFVKAVSLQWRYRCSGRLARDRR